MTSPAQYTLSQHYSKYTGVAPQEVIDSAMSGYKELVTNHNLKPVETVQASKTQV